MTKTLRTALAGLVLTLTLSGLGCVNQTDSNTGTSVNNNSTANIATTTLPATATPTPIPPSEANAAPLTLPVLDAFFADPTFGAELKSKLQLSDEQIARLRTIAREGTSKLSETNADELHTGATTAARTIADEQIKAAIGAEKAQQLAALVHDRWSGGAEGANVATNGSAASDVNNANNVSNVNNVSNANNVGNANTGSNATTTTAGATSTHAVNAIPTDTRIVVNAPAYRMDVFESGKLIKSYKVGIGYPEFPLPTGLRKASTIIFNPTWTPPDSPWVESMKNVKAGEKVEAGSKLNPLGPIKIPIGMPSLIHGGKSAAKLGGFASHGCVGLTNAQVSEFARTLSEIGGTPLSDADVAAYAKNKTETKDVKLAHTVPIELRYETIVVQDGKLHIYRDVYDHNTNTEANLRAALQANGVTLDQLSEKERTQALNALKEMSQDVAVKTDAGKNGATPKAPTVTRTVKGRKEIVIEIATLAGKGYPAPVALNTGNGVQKQAAPATTQTSRRR
jgi:lipoprotein-anchoring transpeptidase ErfK/SrfK